VLCSSVGIVGLGLIGGSIGKGLLESRSVDRVLGWDVDGNVLEHALSSKAITSIASPEETIEETELLIIATPPSKMTALSKTLAPLAGKNLKAVVDTASTKSALSKELSLIWKEKYVGLHPMAGKEKGGIHNATAEMLYGAVCALVPTDISDGEAAKMAKDLICTLGMLPVITGPEEHDEIVALTSHLPMFLAISLALSAFKGASKNHKLPYFIAGGFKDTTRVASCPPWLVTDVWETNRGFIKKAINEFIDILSELSEVEPESLCDLATEAKEARESLLKRRGEISDRN